ncbi:MAG: acetylornithine deacetylase, partial [Casimicrobiaceae bacterium]
MNAPGTLREVRPAAVRADDIAALDLIRTWIGFDTTSRESNLALIDWTRAYLEGHGALTALTFDDDRRKANLFATLPAVDGNTTTGGIVLSGHTDV